MAKEVKKEEHRGPYRLGDLLPPKIKITACPPAGFPKAQKAKAKRRRHKPRTEEKPAEGGLNQPDNRQGELSGHDVSDLLERMFGKAT